MVYVLFRIAGFFHTRKRENFCWFIIGLPLLILSKILRDVDMTGAGAGASGAAVAASGGASSGTVTGEKKRAQEEAKRRMERIQAALAQLGSGDDMKEVRDKLNQEMSGAKKASEPRGRGKPTG